ncbi:MAG TPA: type II toxin-antitoxin system RelE/ParE family toxin [Turneriella sp.]|nr:type II toxin-antitoxin system RelE/ParE family toxin [Turneriella sp.]
MKQVIVAAHARQTIKAFSRSVRMELGKYIYQLQMGHKLSMPVSRPMPSVGLGAHEIRLKDEAGIYRVFYYLKVKEKVLVFHAFTKKTQATPKDEIRLGKSRLSALLQEEKNGH